MDIKNLAKNKKFNQEIVDFPTNNYVFACTFKNTNPNANPKSVIAKQIIAVVMISPIFLIFY